MEKEEREGEGRENEKWRMEWFLVAAALVGTTSKRESEEKRIKTRRVIYASLPLHLREGEEEE